MTKKTKKVKVEYGVDKFEILEADKITSLDGCLRIYKDDSIIGEFAAGHWDGWYYLDNKPKKPNTTAQA